MLQHKVGETVNVKLHSWMVDVEVEEGTSLEGIEDKLAGALSFMEGVGHAAVEYLGELEAEVGDSER